MDDDEPGAAGAVGPAWTEATASLLFEHLVQAGVAELDQPHVMICMDPATGAWSLQGPFPDALSAAVAAQRDHDAEYDARGTGGGLRFSVAPLQPVDRPEPDDGQLLPNR